MVDVVRWASGGSPCTVWQPFIASYGSLLWEKLPSSHQSALLLTLSKFGDLRAYCSLSQASRLYVQHLATSLHCLRIEARQVKGQGERFCYVCGELGLAHTFASKCNNCDDLVCEGCVASASFSRTGERGVFADRQPSSWICVWCVCDTEHEDLPTVPSLKTWLVTEAWDIANRVIRHYDFPFYLRLVSLSGEDIVDTKRRRVGIVYAHWNNCVNTVWDSVFLKTGGRVRHLLLGARQIDVHSSQHARWCHLLSSQEARLSTEESPLIMVVLY